MKKTVRYFLLACFLLIPFWAKGYVLHVENKTHTLNTIKETSPALAFGISGTTYYAPLVPASVENHLHFLKDDTVYSICDISDDYCIENGKLYWAHPDLYVKSSGTQYIDTGIVPDLNTAIEIEIADTSITTYSLFGVKTGTTVATETGFGISLESGKFGFFRNGAETTTIKKDNDYHVYYLSNTAASVDGVSYDFAAGTKPLTEPQTMYIFGFNHNGYAYDKAMKVRYLKIWNGNTLIRHYVPVYEGLVIGTFVVPENGLFDIVNQIFYPPQGAGSLTYGKE